MSKKAAIGVSAAAALFVAGALFAVRYFTQRPPFIQGAVISRNPDPTRELPLAGVGITLLGAREVRTTKSDPSGYFKISLPWRIRPNEAVTLRFTHADYETLDLQAIDGNPLYVARLTPILPPPPPNLGTEAKVSNLVVDYSMTTTTTVNVGSAVKMFEVANEANVPCNGHRPCSPDGQWKANEATASIDAGAGNQFQNARVSCIAGPCPFTRVADNNLKSGSRILQVSVLNWSGTTTFLLEAEVYKPALNNVLRHSYPLIFDRALTFTIPATAESVSIEAETNGTRIVYPLGPALYLSWANCQAVVNKDQTKVYRCELKPEYRFDESGDKSGSDE